MKNNSKSKPAPSFADEWKKHKKDKIWIKFWVLWELKKKWNWANLFYKKLDRVEKEIVAPEFWSAVLGGEGFMNLSLWLSFLRCVHEGITEGCNDLKSEKIKIKDIFEEIPDKFKNISKDIFKDFRNATFHCQWHPNSKKLNLDQETVNKLAILHEELGTWIYKEIDLIKTSFMQYYKSPTYWAGVTFMEDSF